MTAKQAIEALLKCPPDAVIVVANDGGEGWVEQDVLGAQPRQAEMGVHLNGHRSVNPVMLPGSKVVVLD